jgi:hypothetical protein
VRKITVGLLISLDGVVDVPDQWRFPYFNDEMGDAVDPTLGGADTSCSVARVARGRRGF